MELPLKESSPQKWVETVLDNFPNFILDHAACERKAAALAMSFVAKYSDRKALIEPMVSLAREELEHFQQVYKIIFKMGLELSPVDEKDPYVNIILKQLRHGRDERLLDRLIMSGIIEARGYERFRLIAENLDEPNLKDFYQKLSKCEAGHYAIFIKLAHFYFPREDVLTTIDRISIIESEAMLKVPIRATLH
ncbi:MAG: tRNA-(ms[2]io[6]A)-hydroxylase [Bdellovibrionota bacterium]